MTDDEEDEISTKNLEKQLEAFVLDPDLEELEKEIGRFNLFDILNANYNEYLHSQIIRWFLDPNESHGLKDYFLKMFLKRVLQSNGTNQPLSPIEIDVLDFKNCIVQSEEVFSNKRRGDISIINTSVDPPIYILIENKIGSGEGELQTIDYVKQTTNRYPDYKRLYIFLTPDEHTAEADEFLPVSYTEMRKILNQVLYSKGDVVNDNAKYLINQLMRNIEVNIVEDSRIEELCLKIYEKHKHAIDKIFEIKPSNKQIYDSLAQSVLQSKELPEGNWKYHAANSYCALFNEDWRTKFNPKSKTSFFHYEFHGVGLGQIRTDIHIEKWDDRGLREKLKEYLKQTDFVKVKEVDLSRGQVILKRKPVRKIDDNDKAIKTGSKAMIALINQTYKYLEEAAKNVPSEDIINF